MSDQTEKALYITTYGGENPEKAAMPFVMANAAMAMDIEASIALQGNAVYLAQKGYAEHMVRGGGFEPITKLIADFISLGGELLVCVPCIKERNIDPSDLIEGSQTTAAGKLTVKAIEADAVFVY